MSDPQRHPSPPAVAALQRNLDDLVTEARALRIDVSRSEATQRKRNSWFAAGLGVLTIFVGLLLVLAWQGNRLTHQNADVLDSVQTTNRFMADCTTPGGRCYQESRARTSEVLADVIRAQIFMAQCARLWPSEAGPDYDRKLSNCVYDRLAKAAKDRKDDAQQRPSPSPAPSPAPNPGG